MSKIGKPGIDPTEDIVRKALDAANIIYSTERDERNHDLDFYLIEHAIHVEVKQFHTDRISEQMSRVPNVIAIQGKEAAQFFALMIREAFK